MGVPSGACEPGLVPERAVRGTAGWGLDFVGVTGWSALIVDGAGSGPGVVGVEKVCLDLARVQQCPCPSPSLLSYVPSRVLAAVLAVQIVACYSSPLLTRFPSCWKV